MTQIPLPTMGTDRDIPLPLRVANKWNFMLRIIEYDGQTLYRLHDWLAGQVDQRYADQRIRDFRRPGALFDQLVGSTHTVKSLKEFTPRYGDVGVEYVSDQVLYRVSMDIRLTKKRKESTSIEAIKAFLTASGAFVDLAYRKPEVVITSGLIDPDQAVEAAINEYRRRGKPDTWIVLRLEGKVKGEQFIHALRTALDEYLTQNHYATATDDIYLGLWRRTASQLKTELGLPRKASLRDNQPGLALAYQGIAEDVAAQKLGDQRTLSWHQARMIVQRVAALIGAQADQTSRFLKMDLATGKPLLAAGR